MFLFKKSSATKKILQTESYIESVKIKRNIPNKITIYVEEREPILQIKTSNTILVIIFLLAFFLSFSIIFLLFTISPIFNVEDIEVKGNSKVSSERIISVSEIKKYKNMFLFKTTSKMNFFIFLV